MRLFEYSPIMAGRCGAVEALLGEPVRRTRFSRVLSSDARRTAPLFIRVARGRYVLASVES